MLFVDRRSKVQESSSFQNTIKVLIICKEHCFVDTIVDSICEWIDKTHLTNKIAMTRCRS